MTEAAERRMRVAVIGGGIIGVTSAIRLLKAGCEVILIERGEIGQGASFGNAGCLNPSSIVPMSMPGLVRQVPKWLMDPLGPLAVRWSYLPRSLPWLLRFIAPGSRDDIRARAAALARLLAPAVDGMDALARESGIASIIDRSGVLFVYRSRAAFLKEPFGWSMRQENGIRFEELNRAAVRDLAPQLARDFEFGVFLPDNGFIRNPERLVAGLAEYFRRQGGEIVRACVTRLEARGEGFVVCTDGGWTHDADKVVVAAGAYSRGLARDLGDRLPLETERGYHVVVRDPEASPRLPIMNVEDKFYATPMDMGLRVAGTVEIAGLRRPPDWRRAYGLLELGRRTFPGLASDAGADRISVWMGHRPSLPDSLPAIGYSRRSRNAVYAFGHGHVGMTAAPGTAGLVADLVLGRQPNVDISRFSPRRFKLTRKSR